MYRNPDSEPQIKRIDSSRTHGFQFHVERGDLLLTRFFGDTISGGKESARELARDYRDRIMPKLPKPLNIGPRQGRSRSNTGVMGVSITEQFNADGTVRLYAEASARPPGSKITTQRIRLEDDTDLQDAINQLAQWRERIYSGQQF